MLIMRIEQIRAKGVFNRLPDKQKGDMNIPISSNVNGRASLFGGSGSDAVSVPNYGTPKNIGASGTLLKSNGTDVVFAQQEVDLTAVMTAALVTIIDDEAFIPLPVKYAGLVINDITVATYAGDGDYELIVRDKDDNILYQDTLTEGTSTIALTTPYVVVGNENLKLEVNAGAGAITGLQVIAHLVNA
jgi:hypothetical protein